MKKHRILLVALVLNLAIGPAFAASRRGGRPLRPPQRPTVTGCMVEIGVTQDQMDVIQAIRQAAVEALKEAETRAEAREIIEQMREDVRAVLTEDQLAALAECLRPDRPRSCMDEIDLTEDQIEAMDAIRQAALEAIKEAESPKDAREIIEQMHQAIEDVLTDEQLAALRECTRPKKPVNCMDEIGLTEDQKDAMEAIRQEAIEALQAAEDREEAREILDQMHDAMMSVLTDEQLAALQECRDAQRHRHGQK